MDIHIIIFVIASNTNELKALLSVFKARPSDPSREKDIGIDKCEVSIEDGGEVKSRLIVQMTCRHGVLKTYHLTFEGASSMHAVFKSETMRNVWSMSSHRLAANAGHFGPKTEQLDIYSENGKAVFTSYTEKVVAGKEVLKQPLTTSISVSTGDFSNFRVEDQLHIIISVKDFKNIVSHAAIMDTEVTASYSHPSKPMQIKYGDEAMHSEFILMTLGEYRGASATPQPAANVNARANSARTQQQPQMQQLSAHGSMRAPQAIIGSLPQSNYSGMAPPQMSMCPPPPRSATANSMRQTPSMSPRRPETPGSRLPPTQASYVARPLFEEEESLFVSQDDEDRMFDPAPDDEDAEMLGWDATAVYVGVGLLSAVMNALLMSLRRITREPFLKVLQILGGNRAKRGAVVQKPEDVVVEAGRDMPLRKECLRYVDKSA